MKSNRKLFILFGIVLVIEVIFYLLVNKIMSINPSVIIFDMNVFYSPVTFYNNISIYTKEIKTYLLIFRILDMIFPVAYALLLIELLIKLESKHIVFPLFALFCDLFENIFLSYKIFHHSYSGDFIVYLINVITITKFSSIFISVIMIIYIIIKERRYKIWN